jgi:hypothetical protein
MLVSGQDDTESGRVNEGGPCDIDLDRVGSARYDVVDTIVHCGGTRKIELTSPGD